MFGHVFCPRPIEWVIELFEKHCYKSAQKIENVVIVKAQVEHLKPFEWFTAYEIVLEVDWIKNRSFQIKGKIYSNKELAIEVICILVCDTSALSFLEKFWPYE